MDLKIGDKVRIVKHFIIGWHSTFLGKVDIIKDIDSSGLIILEKYNQYPDFF